MLRLQVVLLVLVLAVASACAGDAPRSTDGETDSSSASDRIAGSNSPEASSAGGRPKRVDPRRGGFEISLGEWAIAAEARSIRPGPVTFVIYNRGTVAHGFEIELEGESSGHGSGELLKGETEILQPGESTHLRLTLSAGVHKIECLVGGHDDMGMEDLLEVRADASLVRVPYASAVQRGRVAIADFEFAPEVAEVEPGTNVIWRNDDPAEHTVTAIDGDFGSSNLAEGESFSFTFEEPGTYTYRCAIHPEMQGSVIVR